MNITGRLYVSFGIFITSLVLSAVWTGGLAIGTVAMLYLAISMNALALPLIFLTPVFDGIPTWVWYVIVISWIDIVLIYANNSDL